MGSRAAVRSRDNPGSHICSSLGRSIEPLFKKFLLFFGYVWVLAFAFSPIYIEQVGFGVAAASVGVGACRGSLRRAAPSVRTPCGCPPGRVRWRELGKVGHCLLALSATFRRRNAWKTTSRPSRLTERCAATSKCQESTFVRRVAA